MFSYLVFILLTVLSLAVSALKYDPAWVDYNLNQNPNAVYPTEYAGVWENHTFNPSPETWRFPFYTLTVDRYVDGDPTNNEANAGTPFINMPWSGDGYGPLDFTLLDKHHGVIDDWRALITEIHSRDIMGDLIGFQGYLNASTPFNWNEYDFAWKSDRRYHDFQPGNAMNSSCKYPRMWGEDGYPVDSNITQHQMNGCKASEFDQYGDIKGVGAYPSWESQLSKFASVQDRLRAWNNDVLEKIMVMSCIQISMLDIDGFRMDKALQTTPDAQVEFSNYQRNCARQYGKENFLIVGEAVGEIPFSSIYFGRGKGPEQLTLNYTESITSSNATDPSKFVRPFGDSALDGASFHYPTYGALTRFLGLDGPIGFEGVDFVDHWTKLLETDDMVNANTGKFDPRHLYGMTNQDVFRWPSLEYGIERHLLGLFVTILEMPGIPLLFFGEEQAYYVLENLSPDYVFGRAPMASSRAWQLNGCYRIGEEVYVNMPFNASGNGCHDDSVSLDHRDPSHFMRNILKRMYELRRIYPVLNDGYELTTLSSQTYNIYLPGSDNIPSPTGIWSVYRGRALGIQDFDGIGQGNQGVWLIFHNENQTKEYTFDCSNSSMALISAFPQGSTVKNLFFPYEEYTLGASNVTLGIDNSSEVNGCLSNLTLTRWEWKALVPKSAWVDPAPSVTHITPGHDERIQSSNPFGKPSTIPIQIRFSKPMNCNTVADSIELDSTAYYGLVAQLNRTSVQCANQTVEPAPYVGAIGSSWVFEAELINVYDGIHEITVNNATASDGTFTNARDHFMFRFGQLNNPMVFPLSSNYTNGVLQKDIDTGDLFVVPTAAGADKWRYSLNWGSSWSDWETYDGSNATLTPQVWTGTKAQSWSGDHVILNYWSQKAGSADHIQHSELDRGNLPARRWPHVFVEGSWNQYGYDNGLPNSMSLEEDGIWTFNLMAEYPTELIVNVWGMNPDGLPDKSKAFGDVNGDGVLDWLPPNTLADNVINVTTPLFPYLGYKLIVNDGNYNYQLEPAGSAHNQLAIAILIALIPLVTAVLGVYLFKRSFYQVKFNKIGIREKASLGKFLRDIVGIFKPSKSKQPRVEDVEVASPVSGSMSSALAADVGSPNRRTVLIATMEYEIEDWKVKVKIGGLGVMASLMAKNLGHQDLIWVVPCVGDVEYPVDTVGEVMKITIFDTNYEIEVQYHKLRNITFVLLDAPIFRRQTKGEPYPSRMDDLDSAVFYSAWNSCIAKTLKRFEVDLYHINDYHGAVAPLHLLPRTIPVCVSLHNAEFQGLWPLRNDNEMNEICRVFNLSEEIVKKYVQFGEVFNLLHAAASYLRIHQKGFGAVGVSKKYGKRSFARYPIFWGLNSVGALPNPDPSDTGEWNKEIAAIEARDIAVNEAHEAKRGDLRRQAQEWAGLKVDPTAELFVFVGRWSQQKGVDLIADVFFSVLEENPKVQLICIGPVIDLHGKFAALKLSKMMERYPDRVFSKPEFTALPPYIFSGAEFALIPSRDEPFGLVAVEFGRKGALGVGSRVGGLGQMPGWWFTIESTTTKHLIFQFKSAIRSALAAKTDVRAVMRARSGVQRFPVAQWVEDLDILQSRSIKVHEQQASAPSIFRLGSWNPSRVGSTYSTPMTTAPNTASASRIQSRVTTPIHSPIHSPVQSRAPSPIREDEKRNEDGSPAISRGPSGARKSRLRNAPSSPGISRNSSFVSFQDMDSAALDALRLPAAPIQEADENSPSDTSTRSSEVVSAEAAPTLTIPEPAPHPRSGFSFPKTWFFPRDRASSPQFPGPTTESRPITPTQDESPTNPFTPPPHLIKSKSILSLQSIVGDQIDFHLQQTDPFFTDANGIYYQNFEKMLDGVDSKNSEDRYCIEKYLTKSERQWFGQRHNAKLGISSNRTSYSEKGGKRISALTESIVTIGELATAGSTEHLAQFALGSNFVPVKGVRKFFQRKVGTWQVYSFLLALGQIIAANSYQINLLTGENGEAALKLYIISTIYLVSSIAWWFIFRKLRSVYVLSLPFIFYGAAFFLLGMAPYTTSSSTRGWIQNVATGFYAVASASGSFFFALNFGSEGGAPIKDWVFRACAIQGTQQIYVVGLWYWGSTLTTYQTDGGTTNDLLTSSPTLTAIMVPIAVLLWIIGLLLFVGLPNYYRQQPGKVPSFYTSLLRRKIVLWFFVMVAIQNYWLSAPYGRNWRYLFSSSHVAGWSIFVVIIIFFIGIWAAMLFVLGSLTRQHSWVIPIFAIGLGAPRWCQMFWGTSNIGLYVPWGGAAIGAVLGRSLWCWLGVLDAIQGVGFGMILLQTLTRVHIAFTLIGAQVIGSIFTIAARASAPDKIGPGSVFPDFSIDWHSALTKGAIE
ncbi:hypothetical protein B7494_g5306 [Chlorociboria aeruginascens]|nr:hypothetical protein B7494_g5306 [Chlorociboria aeruginascens]